MRVDFGYDAANEQTSITWYSNLAGTTTVAASAYSYDNAGRLTSIVNTNASSATLSYYTYTYDNADRVTAQTHWSQVGTITYSGTNTYTYDATSQLSGDGTTTYSYDANGNRTMAGYSTGSDNEMSSDGTYTYTYDAVGNLTEKSKGSGLETWYYTYDNANELTGVRDTSNGTTTILQITYTYDALGERVQQQIWQTGGTATITRYDYDGTTLWADTDGSNNLLDRYVYEPDTGQILVSVAAGGSAAGAWVYFTDANGSVRDLLSWNGGIANHIEYTSYGVPTQSNPSVSTIIGYDGYQYEVTTGLYYTWARWYNPSTGTWLTQDPIGFAGGQANLNEYVGNSPVDFTDRFGLIADSEPEWIPGRPPVPKLSYKETAPPTGAMEGRFWWVIDWEVSAPPDEENGGWIVQHVVRKRNGVVVDDYYEAWRVEYDFFTDEGEIILPEKIERGQPAQSKAMTADPAFGGAEFPENWDDMFLVIDPKRATWEYEADAVYFPNLKDLPREFRQDGVKAAGGLFSMKTGGNEDVIKGLYDANLHSGSRSRYFKISTDPREKTYVDDVLEGSAGPDSNPPEFEHLIDPPAIISSPNDALPETSAGADQNSSESEDPFNQADGINNMGKRGNLA